jgi:hypothetical protein
MFDIVFSSTKEGDDAFRAALERYRDKVVIEPTSSFRKWANTGVVPISCAKQFLIPERECSMTESVRVFFPDLLDQKIRSVRYTITERQLDRTPAFPGEKEFEALSARALEKLGHANDVPTI